MDKDTKAWSIPTMGAHPHLAWEGQGLLCFVICCFVFVFVFNISLCCAHL